MWVFKTPPFGWSYSPLLCQRFLAHLVGRVGLTEAGAVLRLMFYLDNFLVFGDRWQTSWRSSRWCWQTRVS